MEDREIIKQVLQGDTDSFRLIVERYHIPVIRFVRNMISDNQMCEDIAQDVFLTAYKKLSSFDPYYSKFPTWLFVIARNKSINVLKKKKPLSMEDVPEKMNIEEPSDKLAQNEFFEKLDEILDSLPLKQKEAFILAEFEKLPYARIAEIQGARIGTVRSRINRAKNNLKSALKDFEGYIS
ncbi:MAG: sigma-70 family RNA polymerase sigma factor [Sedimentisphaerales bacterium]|nr:sigma-70 family RNA polymerase sigma factor [Sedimentisphaerales bacterium]